jgi:Mn-containing catalase
MYHHVKKLMFTVRVDEPDVRFGKMLLEQFGGPTANLRLRCSTRSKGSTLRTRIVKIS